MNSDDTLLCVVDLQQKLLPAIADQATVVWNVQRLLQAAQYLEMAVVATEQSPEKLGSTVEPVASLLREPAASKVAFSCGACTSLFAGRLEEGIQRVLLCGIETHVCVQQTAYDLTAAGFQVFLATDATAARHRHDYEVALRRMEGAGVVLTTTEAAMFEWCTVAGTPVFRQISQLVKQQPPAVP